jgi:hypothetical protein
MNRPRWLKAYIALIGSFPVESLKDLTAEDLDKIRSLAVRQNLFMLVYVRLRRAASADAPDGTLTGFLLSCEPLYLRGVARTARQDTVAAEVLSALNSNGMPAMVIKGSAIARHVYNNEYCRASSDIDILVREADVFRANDALRDAGYKEGPVAPLDFSLGRIHHELYFHPVTHLAVELHWNFGIPGFFRLSSDDIWKEVIYSDGAPSGLSAEMTLVLLFMHHYMHFFRDFWVLVDVLHALRRYGDSLDLAGFAVTLRGAGLAKTALITLNQIRDVWGSEAESVSSVVALRDALEGPGPRPARWMFSYFTMDILRECFAHSRSDRIAARFALDRPSVIAGSFIKTFLPPAGYVMKFYGDTRWSVLPYHYIRFIFGRIKEWAAGKG